MAVRKSLEDLVGGTWSKYMSPQNAGWDELIAGGYGAPGMSWDETVLKNAQLGAPYSYGGSTSRLPGAGDYSPFSYTDQPSYGSPAAASTGGTTGGPTSGLVSPDAYYPISDPLKAVRNVLRNQGIYGNPFNPYYEALTKQLAAGVLPQFMGSMLGGGGTGYDMGTEFSNFIRGRIGGQIAPWNYQQAGAGIGNINALLRQVAQAASMSGLGPGALNTPEGLAALTASGKLSPLQLAFGGLLASPQRQAEAFLSSYLPSLGIGLTEGLRQIISPQMEAFSDFLGPQMAMDPKTQFMSLLDLLTGSLGIPVQRY